jgi:hypothetical protein
VQIYPIPLAVNQREDGAIQVESKVSGFSDEMVPINPQNMVEQ